LDQMVATEKRSRLIGSNGSHGKKEPKNV